MKITDELIESVIRISKEAGRAILDVYESSSSDFEIQIKSDDSPLTKADLAAHKIITQALQQNTPNVPIISEESVDIGFEQRKEWQRFWLVDPLDGTKEFIRRNDDFSVNIALVSEHKVIFGLVYIPVFNLCYWAAEGRGAYVREGDMQREVSVKNVSDPMKIVVSRSHGSPKLAEFIKKIPEHEMLNRGSALKICMIADGQADIYPRFGPTSEWDTAAAQCVLEEAGGALLVMHDQQVLCYNTKPSLVNPEFIAIGDKAYNWQQFFSE